MFIIGIILALIGSALMPDIKTSIAVVIYIVAFHFISEN